MFRSLQLILKPKIDNREQLATGRMKFALLDIFLSVSLFSVLAALLSVFNPELDINNSLSVFSSQFVLLLTFGYYGYCSTAAFFVISASFMYIFRPTNNHPFEAAFLASLHYARCYSLALFLFVPLVAIYLNSMFTELLTVNEFMENHILEGYLALAVMLFLILRCCVVPIKKFWSQVRSNVGAYIIVLIVIVAAFSANLFAPKIGALELNEEKARSLFMQSNKVTNTAKEKREGNVNGFCRNENITNKDMSRAAATYPIVEQARPDRDLL